MPTYRELLKEAILERQQKEDLLNFADKDFVESIIYEIKALDSKIKVLRKRAEVEEYENKMDKQEANCKFDWNGYILACISKPIGAGIVRTGCRECNRR